MSDKDQEKKNPKSDAPKSTELKDEEMKEVSGGRTINYKPGTVAIGPDITGK